MENIIQLLRGSMSVLYAAFSIVDILNFSHYHDSGNNIFSITFVCICCSFWMELKDVKNKRRIKDVGILTLWGKDMTQRRLEQGDIAEIHSQRNKG